MKIRTGFVSNSSSTSFCIVGIHIDPHQPEDLKLLKALGYSADTYGPNPGDLYGPSYGMEGVKHDLVVVGTNGPELVGINAQPLLDKDMRLSEIQDKFLKTLKKMNFVPRKKPTLEIGEAGE